MTPALANTFGPVGCCRWADSSLHTWLNSASGSGAMEWGPKFKWAMNNELDPTDMLETEVSYHHNGSTYVDISWWTSSSIYPASGIVTCDVPLVGDDDLCDHWHMIFYPGSTGDLAFHRHVACQEIGHSVGLDHSIESDSCMNNSAPSATGFSYHDAIWHINGRY